MLQCTVVNDDIRGWSRVPRLLLVVLLALVGGMATAGATAADDSPMRALEPSEERLAAGAATFAICGSCHGPKGEGKAGIGPSLVSDTFLAAASDDYLFRTIGKGRVGTTMIPWGSALNEEQIGSVILYLRSLNPVAPAQLDESKLVGEAARGQEVFANVCSGCHGRSGAGYQETANGTGIGRRVFLDEVSNGFLRHVIKHGKSGTAMRGFSAKASVTAVADLTKEDIDGVILHLRSNAW